MAYAHGGLEATISSHWLYRRLAPHAAHLHLGNPARIKAICSAKKARRRTDSPGRSVPAGLIPSLIHPETQINECGPHLLHCLALLDNIAPEGILGEGGRGQSELHLPQT